MYQNESDFKKSGRLFNVKNALIACNILGTIFKNANLEVVQLLGSIYFWFNSDLQKDKEKKKVISNKTTVI
jgi:hypothetical protein